MLDLRNIFYFMLNYDLEHHVYVLRVKLMKLDENATQFDKIAAAAHQKFNMLAATVVESMVGRKVMAAIVMTSSQNNIDSGCIVSLATGW